MSDSDELQQAWDKLGRSCVGAVNALLDFSAAMHFIGESYALSFSQIEQTEAFKSSGHYMRSELMRVHLSIIRRGLTTDPPPESSAEQNH
jgi:hypothetical protein